MRPTLLLLAAFLTPSTTAQQVAIVEMGAYPGVTSTVGGTLFIEQASGQPMISVRGFLTGLEASVASGGWHIHTGFKCETAEDVGGHYFPRMV